jgi:hypothetical protein
MKKYETKVVRELDDNIDEVANNMEREGWRIVQVVPHRFSATIIFERELKD